MLRSLVGSEMCIRDRQNLLLNHTQATQAGCMLGMDPTMWLHPASKWLEDVTTLRKEHKAHIQKQKQTLNVSEEDTQGSQSVAREEECRAVREHTSKPWELTRPEANLSNPNPNPVPELEPEVADADHVHVQDLVAS
eukprot:TRINITY_DN46425_c0_g1_i1.p1 TRINITY_DN46425_c0_g1~~TRINITY_DN46425_c0_g1_i1.p1  ORF type:complete len:146 (+),score=37.86 TRINITY_DN46425_c0_g1_i1:30-440(+)